MIGQADGRLVQNLNNKKMQFRVKETSQTPEKLTELARLSWNALKYQQDWHEHFGAERRNKMKLAQASLQIWMDENVEPDEDKGTPLNNRKWVD